MSDQSSSPSLTAGSRGSCSPAITRPTWLLSTITDFDERMKAIGTTNSGEDGPNHTFAQLAESYYGKRPQLLSLLQDLYNSYVALCNRYINALAKRDGANCAELESLDLGEHGEIEYSEVHSSLSYQKPYLSSEVGTTELGVKNVENDRSMEESYKKIQLLENLLEILESERMIREGQNADLEIQVAALVEQNQMLSNEKELMKCRVSEQAKSAWKTREEGCVEELTSKIRELEKRVLELEKENKEYCRKIMKREMELENEDEDEGRSEISFGCFRFGKLKRGSRRRADVKKMNIFKDGH
ncbi:hypothetical protein SAY86_016080 [Trapa natans]|uniref:NAB domain-containing protein n=1 Tax=Trapa natans TaxID=22666 RepID=A0AAN7L5T8_TRANT|nr:hypothetical protein SAY86_016080 [Trapa natans]